MQPALTNHYRAILKLLLWLALAVSPLAQVSILCRALVAAQPNPLVLASDSNRVFISGVSDTFDSVRAAVDKAKQTSGRDYRVIVVSGGGGEENAATEILNTLVDRWNQESATQAQVDGQPLTFDPAGDVTIVLDVKDRQIAMRAPWGLEVSSGLSPETIQNELIEKIFVPRAKNDQYDLGLADLVDAIEIWVKTKQDRTQARAEASRVFRTVTLPISLAVATVLAGLIAFFLQRSRHDRRMHEAREKLAAFKSEVVSLSDLLDSQQERHRMLPHTDPDFQTPIQGLTRSSYDGVQSAIRRYREAWLSLMDIWEKAEARINDEWFLGTAAADDAIALLNSAAARPPREDVAGECCAPLDALEQAHEKASQLSEEVDRQLHLTLERLDKLTSKGRRSTAFRAVMADISRGIEMARHDLKSDPIASRGRLASTGDLLAYTSGQIDTIETLDDRREKVRLETLDVEHKVGLKRAAGWLLTEPGANPDELLKAAAKAHQMAAQILDEGETAVAQVHVERAEQLTAEAVALMTSIEAAQAKVAELLPVRLLRAEAFTGKRAEAVQALEQMRISSADSAWTDVADNLGKADEGIARVRELLLGTRAAIEPGRQHFLRGLALGEEAVRQTDWVEGCWAAMTARQAELNRLRGSLPEQRDCIQKRVVSLEDRLKRQRTDRVRANEGCREAGRLLEVANRGLGLQRPDWRQVAQVLTAADSSAARAENLAGEDERLAQQARENVEETDALLRRAAAWYAEGVSADLQGAVAALEKAKSLLQRQQYEDSIKSSGECSGLAREAYAAANAEAERRRLMRQQEIQQRQLQESFSRMSRGFGPWVIQLPGGSLSGPDPWRPMHSPSRSSGSAMQTPSAPRSAAGGWSNNTVQVNW